MSFTKLSTIFFAFLYFLCMQANATTHHIVGKVGKEIITKHDLNNQINFLAFLKNTKAAELQKDEEIVKNILNSMIDAKLIQTKLADLKIKISDTDYEKSVSNFLDNFNGKYDTLESFALDNNLHTNTVRDFLFHEASVAKFIEYNSLNMNYSKNEREKVKDEIIQKLRNHYTRYKIIDFVINEEDDIKTFNSLQFDKCDVINSFLTQYNLEHLENEVSAKDLNQGLLAAILSKNTQIGFVEYQAQKEDTSQELLGKGFIAYCGILDPRFSASKSKEIIYKENKNIINSMLNQELQKKLLLDSTEKMRKENHIVCEYKQN